MRTSLELECFDGIYSFRLTMAGIIAIETKCDAGIGEIYARTLAGRYIQGDREIGSPLEGKYRYSELLEVLRQAAIGGGIGTSDGREVKVDATKANHLIATYIHPAPVSVLWGIVASILVACIEGYEPEVSENTKKKRTKGKSQDLTEEESLQPA